jgi:ABC-type antimicrobial peptide transport system, ATPase component
VSSDELLRLEKITKRYGNGKHCIEALSSVDLTVYREDFLPLVGPSGSGKSTLLNIMGLIDVADSGVVRLEGDDMSCLPDAKLSRVRRQKIGFIFQSFNLIPILTVSENVGYPLLRTNLPAREQRERVEASLASVGLEGLGARLPPPALRRAAAAGGDSESAGQAPFDHPGRRADRESGFIEREEDRRAAPLLK